MLGILGEELSNRGAKTQYTRAEIVGGQEQVLGRGIPSSLIFLKTQPVDTYRSRSILGILSRKRPKKGE